MQWIISLKNMSSFIFLACFNNLILMSTEILQLGVKTVPFSSRVCKSSAWYWWIHFWCEYNLLKFCGIGVSWVLTEMFRI